MPARILVVDNAQDMRELFDAILTDQGWQVFSYSYAQVNLPIVQQINPDLIILDFTIHHRGAGWNFLQLLRMEDKTATIPVLVCTTVVTLPPEVAAYLAARNIAVVYKPFDSTPFLQKVEQILAEAHPASGNAPVGLPILVVDDDELLREAISTVLRLEGYLVVTAPSGRLALEVATHQRHGLIILDDAMPDMTGREFLAAYAEEPLPHSPVILASGQANEIKDILPPFVMGKLPKPFQITDLLRLVKQYMQPV